MYSVLITSKAEADLQNIATWWSTNRSSDEAEAWYPGIQTKITSLRDMPRRCRLAVESEHVDLEVRQLLYGVSTRPTHRILFSVKDDVVTVYRILHTSQAPFSKDDL